MEIATLNAGSLRIKGKQTTFIINPQDKTMSYAAAIQFSPLGKQRLAIHNDAVTIQGPGDYEIGGLKVSGNRYDGEMTYSFVVDDMSILLLSCGILAKYHQKLREHDVVIVAASSDDDPSSAVNIADGVVLYVGENAKSLVTRFVKEGVEEMSKFVATKDKLPDEVKQILLQ